MFQEADNFNSDVSEWDISKVTDTANMFDGADDFNRLWCMPQWVGKISEGDFTDSHGRAYCCPTGKFYDEENSDPPSIVCTACPKGQYTDQLSLNTACTTCARDFVAQ